MSSTTSKHDAPDPSLNAAFASIIAPIQRERENLLLQIAAEEVKGMRILASRVQARLEAVGVDAPLRTDGIFVSDALEVLAGSLGSEIGRRA